MLKALKIAALVAVVATPAWAFLAQPGRVNGRSPLRQSSEPTDDYLNSLEGDSKKPPPSTGAYMDSLNASPSVTASETPKYLDNIGKSQEISTANVKTSTDYLNNLEALEPSTPAAAKAEETVDDGAVDAAVPDGATSGSPADLTGLKESLLKQCLGINRGFTSRPEEKKQIKELIKQIEAQNPNPSPNDGFADGTSPLTGDWQLLFTNAPDVLSLALLPGVTIGQIYQNIGSDGTEIVNIVELQPLLAPILPSTVARIVVGAEGSVASPERLDLAFKSSAFTPLTFLGRKVEGVLKPLKFNFPKGMRNVGWLEHTFVDDDIRVARAFGSLFVLLRV